MLGWKQNELQQYMKINSSEGKNLLSASCKYQSIYSRICGGNLRQIEETVLWFMTYFCLKEATLTFTQLSLSKLKQSAAEQKQKLEHLCYISLFNIASILLFVLWYNSKKAPGNPH